MKSTWNQKYPTTWITTYQEAKETLWWKVLFIFFFPIKVVPNIRQKENVLKIRNRFLCFNAILPVSLRLENSNSLMYEERILI